MSKHYLIGLIVACAACAASLAMGQSARHVVTVPQPVRQAPAPGVATFGMPNPAGLASPAPAQATPPGQPSLVLPGAPNPSAPGVASGSPAIDAGIAAPTTTGGGGGVVVLQQSLANGYGANVMGAAGAPRGSGPYSTVDIARAFLDADTNHDGDLSRAEAQRLSIPLGASFDDLDRNHDGVLSRFEYEDAFQ
jgi:hypothetical protein